MSQDKNVKWTTIKVPAELRDRIKALAERMGTAEWRVVLMGVSFLAKQIEEPRIKEDLPLIDKVSWYIAKLAMSVGAFKENPTEENLQRLRRTCLQIAQRYGIDTSIVLRTAEDYMRSPGTDTKIELNMSLKMVIVDMMWKLMGGEVSATRAPREG